MTEGQVLTPEEIAELAAWHEAQRGESYRLEPERIIPTLVALSAELARLRAKLEERR